MFNISFIICSLLLRHKHRRNFRGGGVPDPRLWTALINCRRGADRDADSHGDLLQLQAAATALMHACDDDDFTC